MWRSSLVLFWFFLVLFSTESRWWLRGLDWAEYCRECRHQPCWSLPPHSLKRFGWERSRRSPGRRWPPPGGQPYSTAPPSLSHVGGSVWSSQISGRGLGRTCRASRSLCCPHCSHCSGFWLRFVLPGRNTQLRETLLLADKLLVWWHFYHWKYHGVAQSSVAHVLSWRTSDLTFSWLVLFHWSEPPCSSEGRDPGVSPGPRCPRFSQSAGCCRVWRCEPPPLSASPPAQVFSWLLRRGRPLIFWKQRER